MIAILLATISLLPAGAPAIQQKDASLLQSLIPQPTGQNGLEDYLKAMDLLNDGVSEVYGGWTPQFYESDEEKAAKTKLAGGLKSLDYLAIRRMFVDHYSDAYDSVVQGNSKPCITPPPSDASPKGFPAAEQVASLIQARAYVQSADGKQSESLDTLLNGLTFTLRSGSTNMMAYVSDLIGEQELFEELSDELPRMSLADALRLQSYADQAIKQAPLVADMVRRSARVHELMFAKNSASKVLLTDNSRGNATYHDALEKATPDQQQAFSQAAETAASEAYREQEQVLELPESQWYDGSSAWKAEFGQANPLPTDTLAQLAVSLAHEIVASYRNLALNELKRRARMRLLGLHARIIEYRWHNHRLPQSLKEIADAQTLFDPLSADSFEYVIGASGAYRLFSKGRPETGPIELHSSGKHPGASDALTP